MSGVRPTAGQWEGIRVDPAHDDLSGSRSVSTTTSRRWGRAGELALRERGGDYEIVSNGVFLMDTRDGRSERLLVRWALEAMLPSSEGRVLIAGLGVGWSLAEALASPDVVEVLVIEWEEAVVTWNRTTTGARTGGCVTDPRVRCEITDLVAWLQRPSVERFDVICLDVDNGPGWTVSPANGWLYADQGLRALRDRLAEGGVLTVWSAQHDAAFEHRLQRHLRDVRHRELQVPRGGPDVVYLAER